MGGSAGRRDGKVCGGASFSRRWAALLTTMAVLGGGWLGAMPRAAAEKPKPKPTRDLPGLPSATVMREKPETPTVGDDLLNIPPHPSELDKVRPRAGPPAFDPARSRVVETTETKKLYANPDGTQTVELSTKPVRFRDEATGGWRDIDLTLVPGADGTLGATAAAASAPRLSPEADATAAVVPTPAGTIGLRVPGAAAAPARVRGHTATYPGAAAGRDLALALTVDGVEESVVLPDAHADRAHRVQFALPAGLTARQSGGHVEFVDAKGAAVASFGSGLARDSGPGGGSVAPVAVRLASSSPAPGSERLPYSPPARALAERARPTGALASVEVSLDASWLADPARVFPVTVDPTLALTSVPGSGMDDWIWSAGPNDSWGTAQNFLAGPLFGAPSRALVWFNLGVTPAPNWAVSSSYLRLYNYSSMSCTPTPTELRGLAGPWSEYTTWATQPPTDPFGRGLQPQLRLRDEQCLPRQLRLLRHHVSGPALAQRDLGQLRAAAGVGQRDGPLRDEGVQLGQQHAASAARGHLPAPARRGRARRAGERHGPVDHYAHPQRPAGGRSRRRPRQVLVPGDHLPRRRVGRPRGRQPVDRLDVLRRAPGSAGRRHHLLVARVDLRRHRLARPFVGVVVPGRPGPGRAAVTAP